MASAVPLIRRRPLPLAPIAAAGIGMFGVVALALTRQIARGAIAWPSDAGLWLILHLVTVVPALPLGAYLLWRRKGDRLHKALGRVWAGLMVVGALSSFGLKGLMGHLSPIHLLSVLTLVGVPRAVWQAARRDVAGHRATIVKVYLGLVAAGLFAFVPGRLLHVWLLG